MRFSNFDPRLILLIALTVGMIGAMTMQQSSNLTGQVLIAQEGGEDGEPGDMGEDGEEGDDSEEPDDYCYKCTDTVVINPGDEWGTACQPDLDYPINTENCEECSGPPDDPRYFPVDNICGVEGSDLCDNFCAFAQLERCVIWKGGACQEIEEWVEYSTECAKFWSDELFFGMDGAYEDINDAWFEKNCYSVSTCNERGDPVPTQCPNNENENNLDCWAAPLLYPDEGLCGCCKNHYPNCTDDQFERCCGSHQVRWHGWRNGVCQPGKVEFWLL